MHSLPYRPTQLRCVIFPSTYLPHLHSISSDSYWASVCLATLPDIPCLLCDFSSSDQRFASRLPSDSTSRWTPLSLAMCFQRSGHTKVFHRLDYAHAGRIITTGLAGGLLWPYKGLLPALESKDSLNGSPAATSFTYQALKGLFYLLGFTGSPVNCSIYSFSVI